MERWDRLQEWVYGKKRGEASPTEAVTNGYDPAVEISLDLKEDFGETPENAGEYADRAEAIYASLAPPTRKRAARHLLTQVAIMGKEGNPVNPNELISNVGRFDSQIREVMEYFIRQGILRPEGGLRFAEPSIPTQWDRLKDWVKTA